MLPHKGRKLKLEAGHALEAVELGDEGVLQQLPRTPPLLGVLHQIVVSNNFKLQGQVVDLSHQNVGLLTCHPFKQACSGRSSAHAT